MASEQPPSQGSSAGSIEEYSPTQDLEELQRRKKKEAWKKKSHHKKSAEVTTQQQEDDNNASDGPSSAAAGQQKRKRTGRKTRKEKDSSTRPSSEPSTLLNIVETSGNGPSQTDFGVGDVQHTRQPWHIGWADDVSS
ncbi:NF-kappa-B-activating protein-like isoform X2 [Pseudophryne corroboree]|uniref:NF-kappa-B-activating protein-like isoform X2 n=1 Tax=Pseudophryne corroboree TaxID=495146 RepID=UPI00308201B3